MNREQDKSGARRLQPMFDREREARQAMAESYLRTEALWQQLREQGYKPDLKGTPTMKPSKLPTLKIKQRNDGVRVVLYWVMLYAIAAAIVLLDCIVWRP